MKTIYTLLATLALMVSANAVAEDVGFEDFDLSLEGVNLDADMSDQDFEFIFDEEKDSPETLADMLAAETAAWEDHVSNMDKWNEYGIQYQRSYRYGYRNSFCNGYRYGNRYSYDYNYRVYRPNHRAAYQYSYWRVANRHRSSNRWNQYDGGAYRSGYGHAYRSGYSHGSSGYGHGH